MDHDDSEERRKAVQRFMARAEISMVSAGAPYVIHDASAPSASFPSVARK